jgi:two-component system chemotaxis sensor kinase CheA
MSDDLDDIQGIFFEECAEGLAVAEQGLTAMLAGNVSKEVIANVFRAVHSIKGGSGAFGHAALLAFSHSFENVLDEVRGGHIPATQDVTRTMLTAFDVLSDHVAAARGASPVPVDGPALQRCNCCSKPAAHRRPRPPLPRLKRPRPPMRPMSSVSARSPSGSKALTTMPTNWASSRSRRCPICCRMSPNSHGR